LLRSVAVSDGYEDGRMASMFRGLDSCFIFRDGWFRPWDRAKPMQQR